MFRGQMYENRGGRLFNGKWVGLKNFQVAELFSGKFMFRGQMNENRGCRLFNGKWVGD